VTRSAFIYLNILPKLFIKNNQIYIQYLKAFHVDVGLQFYYFQLGFPNKYFHQGIHVPLYLRFLFQIN